MKKEVKIGWLSRFYQVLNTTKTKDLMNFLNLSQPTVAKGITKKTPPASWVLSLVIQKNINPNWLIFGSQHPKFLVPSEDDRVTFDFLVRLLKASCPNSDVQVTVIPKDGDPERQEYHLADKVLPGVNQMISQN